ncbi:YfhH family protein [Ectobacillus ponti]|uniref:YfhH family protein n=1 Tax=Ectobacillus ponti TaxID=2961894 RepID=A0AA41XCM6_9BACI|nr:YfhH family protein [Ectobacillus ponti]MCP8970985.1 YfhH family protein [Ectobacillus ponti]
MRELPKRYSEMTERELHEEVARLKEQAIKAEQLGMANEYEVLARKMIMAQAYMTDVSQFAVGETYEITEEPGVQFTITYFNGVFAWGYRSDNQGEEIGVPISIFKKPERR